MDPGSEDIGVRSSDVLDTELNALRQQVFQLQVENARLQRLLELTPQEARLPDPAQTAIFDVAPGAVHAGSSPESKVRFFQALFAARTDVYAERWENARSGKSGWKPAVRGGWRKGIPASAREYLPLTEEILTSHLSGELELGLYPMLDRDRCGWLAADFDGQAAMLDALSYMKAARAVGAPAALEMSRSGLGAHVWLFFASPVPAASARQVGSGLLREAIALRGRMDLASYDRLFPSQDVLQVGGMIDIATLQTLARRDDLATLTAGYGLVIVDECHHVPAAAFEYAVRQIPARRWLGLTATPYRRDQLDELIGLQLGQVRQTMIQLPSGTMSTRVPQASPPEPVLFVHPTSFEYSGGADPSEPGGIAAVYRDLVDDPIRTQQVVDDVMNALGSGRHALAGN